MATKKNPSKDRLEHLAMGIEPPSNNEEFNYRAYQNRYEKRIIELKKKGEITSAEEKHLAEKVTEIRAYRESERFSEYHPAMRDVLIQSALMTRLAEFRKPVSAAAPSICPHCGEEVDTEGIDTVNLSHGNDQGLPPGDYCDVDCITEMLEERADEWMNNVYLINGHLVEGVQND